MSILCAYLVLMVIGWFAVLAATAQPDTKFGILWQPGAWWIGCHYSPFCKRYCINVIPCVTLWITEAGGKIPHSTR